MGYTQDERKISLDTLLGKDVLLFKGLAGEEALLGQKVTVKMKMGVDETPCFLNGLCHRVRQGGRDDTFTNYRIGMVPDAWNLGKKARSRIFQQKKVPDILRTVFKGIDVDWRRPASRATSKSSTARAT